MSATKDERPNCKRCDGTGTVRKSKQECPKCKGEGKFPPLATTEAQ